MANLKQIFLEDIFNNPHDDTVRLIYADWLDERGDPRGEFIRIQVELDNQQYWVNNRTHILIEKEQELLKKHKEEWIYPIDKEYNPLLYKGFVGGIEILNDLELLNYYPIVAVKLGFSIDSDNKDLLIPHPRWKYITRFSCNRNVTCSSIKILYEILKGKQTIQLPASANDTGRWSHKSLEWLLRKLTKDGLKNVGLDFIDVSLSVVEESLSYLKLNYFDYCCLLERFV